MKKSIWLIAVLCLMACTNKTNTPEAVPELSGTLRVDNEFGDLIASCPPADMYKAGFQIGDMVTVQVEGYKECIVPFVTSYNEVGMLSMCICDYRGAGKSLDLALSTASLAAHVDVKDGTPFTFKLYKQGAYLSTMALLSAKMSANRSDYDSPEQYANFRVSATQGIAPNRLFASSNPINVTRNPVRYAVADSLASVYGIQCEVDIADSDELIANELAAESNVANWSKQLQKDNKVVALNTGVDYYSSGFQEPLARGLRFMIEHDGPYLIYCIEGKERAGFVYMLLEALAGASIDEMVRDYMVSYENYYHYEPYSEQWQLAANFSIRRAIWLIIHPEVRDDIFNADWDSMDFTGVDAYAMAVGYLRQCGLTDQEITALKDRLTKKE